ncbi:hypothetical protein WUBG_13918, partial [Wuchereria bancrofti]
KSSTNNENPEEGPSSKFNSLYLVYEGILQHNPVTFYPSSCDQIWLNTKVTMQDEKGWANKGLMSMSGKYKIGSVEKQETFRWISRLA